VPLRGFTPFKLRNGCRAASFISSVIMRDGARRSFKNHYPPTLIIVVGSPRIYRTLA
jgi:hypothetical protein